MVERIPAFPCPSYEEVYVPPIQPMDPWEVMWLPGVMLLKERLRSVTVEMVKNLASVGRLARHGPVETRPIQPWRHDG
mgnify:CR=1 FL=1